MNKLDLIIPEVEEYVSGLLTRELPDGLVYHNIKHTRRVVKQAEIIGFYEHLDEEEMGILKIAAWFHDVGYLRKYKDHEEVSVQMAKDFLRDKGLGATLEEQIMVSIRSTVLPQKPVDKISKVLCDADMMHMGMKKYPDIIKKLRKEWKLMGVASLSKKGFRKASIKALKAHRYHTGYCQQNAASVKEQNLRNMETSLTKKKKASPQEVRADHKSKMRKYSRGADSMLRLTARNQINLSSIADNKSNILISLNGIIISLVLALMVRKFDERPEFIIPTLIFLLFSLTTIVLAILSTRPQLSSEKSTKKGLNHRRVNLLFFGNFYRMDVQEYENSVTELIKDDPYLYAAMIRDQYYLGKVLARKYRLLRLTYVIFMIGLIISVGSFILVYLPV